MPVAGVSAIGVVPGHTRRGHLTAIMRTPARRRARGGRARRGAVGVRGRDLRPLRLRPRHARDALRAAARPRRAAARRARSRTRAAAGVAPAAALERIRPVFDRVRAARPGMLDRPGAWWDRRIHDPEHRRDGAGPLRAAIQPGAGRRAGGLRAVRGQVGLGRPRPGRQRDRARARRRDAGGARRARGASCSARPRAHAALAARPDHDPLTHLLTGNDASTAAPATACSCGCSTTSLGRPRPGRQRDRQARSCRDARGARRPVALPARARPRPHAAVAARARPRPARAPARATTPSTAARATGCSCGCSTSTARCRRARYATPRRPRARGRRPVLPLELRPPPAARRPAASRTDEPADLALGAEALGAIYLGGTPVTALAAAGRVRELRPGALLEAATAFRSAVEPWCPEIF